MLNKKSNSKKEITKRRAERFKKRAQTIVIMNENHSLLQEQEEILNEKYEGFEFLHVPAEGWTVKEMDNIVKRLSSKDYLLEGKQYLEVVFVSPIPYLIRELTREEFFIVCDHGDYTHINVRIFHNSHREKKELPNGRIIQVVAQEGWELV